MKETWIIFRKYCVGKTRVKLRKLVCMSMIDNVGLSGMASWVVPKTQADRFTSLFCWYVRQMMHGQACSKDWDAPVFGGVYKKQTNEDVLR